MNYMVNIEELALNFVNAIRTTQKNNEFTDRMKNFPIGCCDDVYDLFAYYLFDEFGIKTVQLNGFIESEDTYHNWLVTEDDMIIDLTIKQFSYFNDSESVIYFGYSNEFYFTIDRKNEVKHCDIKTHQNLKLDYKLILNNIK